MEEAERLANNLQASPAIEHSTLVQDANGKPILAYFSYHIVQAVVKPDTGTTLAQTDVVCEPVMQDTIVDDGIPVMHPSSIYTATDYPAFSQPHALDRKRFDTHMLFHLQPKELETSRDGKKMEDARHREDVVSPVMVYHSEDGSVNVELKGLRHDVHAWQEQGHPQVRICVKSPLLTLQLIYPQKGFMPSVDLVGGPTTKQCQARALSCSDGEINMYLHRMIAMAFPELYPQLLSAYAAGHRWTEEEPGIMLGKVSLWKLQVGVHRDCKDFLCAIFNAGEYDGGAAVFPDIGLRFKFVIYKLRSIRTDVWFQYRYSPGHVIIFRSDALYHGVERWTPKVMKLGAPFTPGRVAWVYLSHREAVEKLSELPAGWSAACANGTLAHLVDDRMRPNDSAQ